MYVLAGFVTLSSEKGGFEQLNERLASVALIFKQGLDLLILDSEHLAGNEENAVDPANVINVLYIILQELYNSRATIAHLVH